MSLESEIILVNKSMKEAFPTILLVAMQYKFNGTHVALIHIKHKDECAFNI